SNVPSNGNGSTYSPGITNTGTSNITKYYRVVVGGDGQSKTSGSVSVTYRPQLVAGSITGGGQTTYSGGSVTLTAHPSGGTDSGFTYQWQVSDNNSSWSNVPSNGNGSTYSASSTNTGSSNIVKYYRVVVGGDGQSKTSGSVSVTWRPALVAGNITGGGSFVYGASVTLTANPSGGTGSGFTYQWQVSDNNSSWSNVPSNGNGSTYSASSTNTGSSNITKYYRVVVSGDSQSETSESVMVTYRPQLVAGIITGGGVFISDAVVTLTANPSGGTGDGFTYQWQQSNDNDAWSNATGEINKTITVSGSDQTKYYRVIVDGDNQSKTSASVSVTWGEALIAGSISGATSTYTGNSVTLTVSPASGGNGTYNYQWQVFDGANWSNIGGEEGFTYAEINTNTSGVALQKQYRVKVTDGSQTAYTEEVTVTWRTALVAGNIVGGTTTYSGNSVTLTASPSGGDGNYVYQWQVSEDNTEWTDIPGATFNSISEMADNETNDPITMYYRVLVSGDYQNSTSEVTSITRRPSLKISNIQPVGNNIVYGGDDVNLTVTAFGGDGVYSYQWFRKDAESDWTPVGGNSLLFTDNHDNYTDASINYQYKVVVSGDSQEKTSAEFQCSWVAFMSIRNMMYADEKLSYGANTSISIIVTNGSGIYDYQWQTLVNGEWQNIPDNDNPVFAFTITQAGDYRCVVTDSLYPTKSVTSDVVSLDVWPDLIPGEAFGYSYTVVADPVTIGGTAASGGNGTYQYRWEKCSASDNGVFIPIDETTPTIDVLPDCNTTYRRYDISGDQEKLAFEIQVNVPLKSGAIGVDGLAEFYYAGQQLPMLENKTEASGGNVGGTASYQWYWRKEGSSGFEPIEGATEADYQPSGLPVTTSFYRAIVDGDDVRNSNVIELVIRVPEILVSNLKQRYCKGDRVGINASGVENGVYKWFDASGKQIGSGAELSLNSIDESATLTLKTFLGDDDLLNEKDVALTVVDMTPDFASDRIIVDAGDVVHFTNNGSDYTQCEWDFGDGADGSFESEPWHYYNHGGTFDVKLRLTSSEGCQVEITKAGAIIVNEAVSTDVEADKAGSVSVYPNPVTDWLTVEADGEFVVTITNNLGSVVFKSTASTNLRIDITNYPEGIYTVGVVDGAGNAHFEQIVKY
ncbi:MAG: T9SS type A sorting domain-containing protein, partial [Salinivirgaceae bacterium]|nr:T9SS type A sorting domain-containing protein [Salinivirgaceae bacterium]